MEKISFKKVLGVIQRSLNFMDSRMEGHGEEVAYIMYKLLKASNSYSEEEILRLVELAVFHDIGVYKVEEIDKLLEFNLNSPIEHAVYGFLFVKYFSPLSNLAEVILGHHINPRDLDDEKKKIIPEEALILQLADYISILKINNKDMSIGFIMDMLDGKVLPKHKKLLKIACIKYDLLEKIKDDSYVKELHKIFDNILLTREEVISYIRMLTYTIDFRSESMVVHTITVEEISFQIANIFNLSEDVARKIKNAAMMHDIGKIAIPIEILENTSKLTDEEYKKIKEHAIIGYKILSDLGLDDLRDISALHHEKLDGTGYPFGLKGDEISFEARIVAIADLLSALVNRRSYKDEFSKEEVISILLDMVLSNKIDGEICNAVVENYDYIMSKVRENTKNMLTIYNNLNEEYRSILNYFKIDV